MTLVMVKDMADAQWCWVLENLEGKLCFFAGLSFVK
jgi:hypothetical protein